MGSRIFRNYKLGLILLLYLVLAVSYSVVVPIGRGADEWAHYWYAQFIAQHRRLPANPAEQEMAGYKSDWPPLYHLFVAGLTGWVEADGPPTFKYRTDQIRRQLAPAQGPEAILHTEDELFPWRQEILVWHLGRFLSILFSTGTLLVTYLLGLELLATLRRGVDSATRSLLKAENLALAAVAMLAFNPRFLFTGMLLNYDSLTLLLASLFLWLAIRVTKGYHPCWGFWGLGLLAGLALLTKYLTLLLPLEILAIAVVRTVAGRKEDGSTPSAEAAETAKSRLVYALSSSVLWIRLGQAALAYGLVVSWWFVYLIVKFNEIERYGLLLGVLAPLIRGDASDRTVEELFARLSGGQAPPPAFIERQIYPAWQIVAEFPTTFWGNAVVRPYPLTWFIWAMALVTIVAALGIGYRWFRSKKSRLWLNLLLLHCALPVPFMLMRLFGARDALEAVQGRHILFLAGPAVAILLVLGLVESGEWVGRKLQRIPNVTGSISRLMLLAVMALLLTGAVAQLELMRRAYPPLLPVRTEPFAGRGVVPPVTLPGGAQLIEATLSEEEGQALPVSLIWQAGANFAPEDYQVELALVDSEGNVRANWRAYQTQARYPTRAWEPGDVVRDEGWLPLAGLPAGRYEIRLRLLGAAGPVTDWQTLALYELDEAIPRPDSNLTVWHNGDIVAGPPEVGERATVQITTDPAQTISHLVGPDGIAREPAAAGPGWANFIVAPDWPAGDYRLDSKAGVILRVRPSRRNFQRPAEAFEPLKANFGAKVRLLGYRLPTRRVEAGDGLPVTLYWQGLDWLGEEFVIFTRLLDNQGFVWGGYDRLAQENYSTLLWAPGEIIVDGFAAPVEPEAPDGVYRLSVGWYRTVEGEAESLPILDPETGQPTGETAVTIGPIKVGGPPPGVTIPQASPKHQTNVALGDKVELLGFDAARTGSALDLTLYWQATGQMDTDYTVFVHIRDESGETVAQKDGPPTGGVYPTGLWDEGEIIEDNVVVPLAGLPAGQYEIVVGMYDLKTGVRLPVNGSADGTIRLQSFELTAGE